MTELEFAALRIGDLVQSKWDDSKTFVVTGNYGTRVTAVKTVDLTNPPEWKLVAKATHKRITP